MLLRADRRVLLEQAISDAAGGHPRVISLLGASGVGKSAHLSWIRDAAVGFLDLSAECQDRPYRPPLALLEALGVARTSTDVGTPLEAAVAAQALRRLIDGQGGDGPTLLTVDDAQWADEESLEALRHVLERVSGDRLLVVVASRSGRGERGAWERYCIADTSVTRVVLDGLDLAETQRFVREVVGEAARPDLVRRLWEHTRGNPMYLRSLLTQYPPDELDRFPELPAPIEVASDLQARLAVLDASAAALLRAIAVLGPDWVDRLEAATLAGIDDATDPIELLFTRGLIEFGTAEPLAEVRIVHALVRAALYQSIPPTQRHALHQRASDIVASPMRRIEHAVAAASRRDEALAHRLEKLASGAHAEGDYRREARLWLWASQVSETASARERRWLESQLATVLARDTAAVRAKLSEIGWATDVARRTVVTAWLLIAENRFADARRALQRVTEEVIASADETTRTRLQVLKAWTMLVSGYPTREIRAVIASVPDGASADPAVRPYFLRTAGQIAGRDFDFDHIRLDFDAVPLEARETPIEDTDKLSWRGSVYALCGFAAEARRDLSETVSRIRGGRAEADSGANHALYGFALWHDGQFDRANVEFQAATDFSGERLYPLVQSMLPLLPIVRGDFAAADALLARSDELLRDLPWHEAVSVHIQAEIARLHAGDDDTARSAYLSGLRARFGAHVTDATNPVGAIWQLHVALARIWAGELDEVEGHLVGIETDMIVPDWSRWCRPWLLGLRDAAAGDAGSARRLLTEAAGLLNGELPLYAAHVLADLARLSAATGDPSSAARVSAEAAAAYSHLGTLHYLDRLPHVGEGPVPRPGAVDPGGPLATLSAREREVAALLLSGFSYAQIAEELYVTRSTVAFHLGRIYAKTGVASRHELIRLARPPGG